MKTFPAKIRAARHSHEIMVEYGELPVLKRRYVKADKAAAYKRQGWVIWYPQGQGWTQR
jgi:hypothetical protein